MKIKKCFERSVIEIPHQIIVMPDGCELSARIWLPEDAISSPVPAILEHLPYRKRDGTIVRDQYTHPWFAGHGYACVRVDMRGSGDSQGLMHDEYTEQEWQDACSVIDWLSKQPFCSGRVGMMGISWGGFNSLQVAALKPPALKAIITLCSTVDRYADDIHYKGGCLLGENLGWAANMLSYSSRPPDPVLVGDQWRGMWMARLENMPFLATPWLAHQSRDDYWKHGSVCEDYSAIDAPVLSIGGWHDGYRNTISHLVEHLSAPVKGIVGPWIHKYPHYAAPEPAIGFLQEAKRWWDRWLKDEHTGVEDDPDYRIWLMDSIAPKRWLPERPGRWIAETHWPSDNISLQPWVLTWTGQNGGLVSASTYTDAQQRIEVQIDSKQSCGQAAGEYFPFAFGPELPDEQSIDDDESAVFDSARLSEAVDIVGAPQVELSLLPDGTAGHLCIRLCDVRPDGASALITMGVLNLKHHKGFEKTQSFVPGESLQVSVHLDHIAYRIPAGHRLRIAVSNAYFPFLWPASELGTCRLTSGVLHLPCRQGEQANEDEVRFLSPEAAQGWEAESLRPASSTREQILDEETGRMSTFISNDFGENKDLQHGLISGSKTDECWSIHPDDPLSAEVVIQWEQNGGRDDWIWSTSSVVSMHCDAEYFYVSGYLIAREGDDVVFEGEYSDSIRRQ